MNHFAVLMTFLRSNSLFLDDIYQRDKLDKKVVALLVSSCVFFAIYGAIVGSFGTWLQILVSAIKLPALYLLTSFICLPTLYFFDIVAGSKRVFGQYLTLILAAMSVISVMLFAFAPITLFFRLSINNYRFFILINIIIFVVSGIVGVKFFYSSILNLSDRDIESPPLNIAVLKSWLLLYGLVGSQLGWTLRPFFGYPDRAFELFRPMESNFYLQVGRLFLRIFFGYEN